MSKRIDLLGKVFGRLTVTKFVGVKYGSAHWECLCSCGKVCVVNGANLRNGQTKSCGCLSHDVAVRRQTTHNKSKTKIYKVWTGIKRRCLNKNDKYFPHYGGRGITVCDEWRNDFQAFFDYVSKLEHFGEEGYSLDRIDNDKGYFAGNLRWATQKEQNRNQRSNAIVEYEGSKMTLAEAAERSGINYVALKGRYARGLRDENLFKPLGHKPIIVEYEGVKMTLREAAELSGVKYETLRTRYYQGWREQNLFAPVDQSIAFACVSNED